MARAADGAKPISDLAGLASDLRAVHRAWRASARQSGEQVAFAQPNRQLAMVSGAWSVGEMGVQHDGEICGELSSANDTPGGHEAGPWKNLLPVLIV